MSYINTFITVSDDCPVDVGVIPASGRSVPPAHIIQYELLRSRPYVYTHEELVFEVHVRHKGIPEEERERSRALIWAELFARKHPCLRASQLPKKYGWGIHYDKDGKIAIYAMESPEYCRLAGDPAIRKLKGMRSSRARSQGEGK